LVAPSSLVAAPSPPLRLGELPAGGAHLTPWALAGADITGEPERIALSSETCSSIALLLLLKSFGCSFNNFVR